MRARPGIGMWQRVKKASVRRAIFNLDEMSVDGDFGHRVKVFRFANAQYGGVGFSSKYSGSGKHLAAVVVTSASGSKLPLFFVFAGKDTMCSWFERLLQDVYKDGTRTCQWLTIPGWSPTDADIVLTANDLTEKAMVPLLIDHVERNVRKFVPVSKEIVVCLNGHS